MCVYIDVCIVDIFDQFWIVEYFFVYMLGLGVDCVYVLNLYDILIVQIDCGGEVIYYGFGQVVIYLLMDLCCNCSGVCLFVCEFVYNIEEVVIVMLVVYNLVGVCKEGVFGIYVVDGFWQGVKVVVLGLKIWGNGCIYYGVLFNVVMDLVLFFWINFCGYEGLVIVDMQIFGVVDVWLDVVQDLFVD